MANKPVGFAHPRVEGFEFLKVGIHSVREEALDEVVKAMLESDRHHQIVLLSLWDLLRARRNAEYRALVQQASLVIPISMSVIRGARFLKKPVPPRYAPFEFIIKLLGSLERQGKSVYLLGSPKKHLQTAERNLRQTFPGMRIVGRYAGYYPRKMEGAIVQAIKKATPSLLLVGRGVPGSERWIYRNKRHFAPGASLWCSDSFDIFAEKRKRVSRGAYARGMEWLPYSFRAPWKLARFFLYLYYKVLLVIYRIKS